VQVLGRDGLVEPLQLGVGGVVDQAEGAAPAPVGVVTPAAAQLADQLVDRAALCRKGRLVIGRHVGHPP
jgi:hypothetical protein